MTETFSENTFEAMYMEAKMNNLRTKILRERVKGSNNAFDILFGNHMIKENQAEDIYRRIQGVERTTKETERTATKSFENLTEYANSHASELTLHAGIDKLNLDENRVWLEPQWDNNPNMNMQTTSNYLTCLYWLNREAPKPQRIIDPQSALDELFAVDEPIGFVRQVYALASCPPESRFELVLDPLNKCHGTRSVFSEDEVECMMKAIQYMGRIGINITVPEEYKLGE